MKIDGKLERITQLKRVLEKLSITKKESLIN